MDFEFKARGFAPRAFFVAGRSETAPGHHMFWE
jgi:hypothetical protein